MDGIQLLLDAASQLEDDSDAPTDGSFLDASFRNVISSTPRRGLQLQSPLGDNHVVHTMDYDLLRADETRQETELLVKTLDDQLLQHPRRNLFLGMSSTGMETIENRSTSDKTGRLSPQKGEVKVDVNHNEFDSSENGRTLQKQNYSLKNDMILSHNSYQSSLLVQSMNFSSGNHTRRPYPTHLNLTNHRLFRQSGSRAKGCEQVPRHRVLQRRNRRTIGNVQPFQDVTNRMVPAKMAKLDTMYWPGGLRKKEEGEWTHNDNLVELQDTDWVTESATVEQTGGDDGVSRDARLKSEFEAMDWSAGLGKFDGSKRKQLDDGEGTQGGRLNVEMLSADLPGGLGKLEEPKRKQPGEGERTRGGRLKIAVQTVDLKEGYDKQEGASRKQLDDGEGTRDGRLNAETQSADLSGGLGKLEEPKRKQPGEGERTRGGRLKIAVQTVDLNEGFDKQEGASRKQLDDGEGTRDGRLNAETLSADLSGGSGKLEESNRKQPGEGEGARGGRLKIAVQTVDLKEGYDKQEGASRKQLDDGEGTRDGRLNAETQSADLSGGLGKLEEPKRKQPGEGERTRGGRLKIAVQTVDLNEGFDKQEGASRKQLDDGEGTRDGRLNAETLSADLSGGSGKLEESNRKQPGEGEGARGGRLTEGLDKLDKAKRKQQDDGEGTKNVPLRVELKSLDPSSDLNDDDDDGADPDLLNDFTLNEYFEPFHNLTLIEDDQIADSDQNEDQDEDVPARPLCLTKKNKELKERGLEYTRASGEKVPARHIRPPCSCRMQCNEKFSDEIRGRMLAGLLSLKSSGQNQFLSSHIDVKPADKHRVVNSQRKYTYLYFLPAVGGRVAVCKVMFASTFDVGKTKIRKLALKVLAGSGIAAEDGRINNSSHIVISAEQRAAVEKHIRSFPRYESHYCRESTSRLYLSPDLNIQKMYDLYLIECRESDSKAVHYNTYRLIFRTFNLSFKKPQKDCCDSCDKFKVRIKEAQDETTRHQIEDERRTHHDAVKEVYRMKKADVERAKQDSTVCTASFDLQKCLPTPYLRCGVAFYKRQLYTFNLTVFYTVGGRHHVACYLWNETVARRGAQEVGSCILRFISDLLEKYPAVKELIMYSDRCAGQNHNYVICAMFNYAVETLSRSDVELIIRHNFMISGHSHMECDSVHASIEKAKRNTLSNIEIPKDWAIFIGQVRRKNPFEVVELAQNEFYALKNLFERFARPKYDNTNNLMKFKPIVSFEYNTANPGIVGYKTSHTQAQPKTFTMAAPEDLVKTPIPELLPTNNQPIKLPKEKLDDLRQLMDFVFNKEYYQTLLTTIVAPKRGRKQQEEPHIFVFDDDMDAEEDM